MRGHLLAVQLEPGGDDPGLGVDAEDVRLAGLRLDGVEEVGVLAGVEVRGSDGDHGRTDGDRFLDLSLVETFLKSWNMVVDIFNIDLKRFCGLKLI